LDSILEVLRELRRQGVILPPFSGLARTWKEFKNNPLSV
jgi:hypothetical protein